MKLLYLGSLLSLSCLANVVGAAILVTQPEEIQHFEQYPSPVPFVRANMLYADFWVTLESTPNKIIMSGEEIAEYNAWNAKNCKALVDWDSFPDSLTKSELLEYIDSISGSGGALLQYPTQGFCYDNGQALTAEDYQRYSDNLNLDIVKELNQVKFGLVVKRELIRRFPTYDNVRNGGLSPDVNMFVESGAFPNEAVAVLHVSKDGEWYLIRKHDYLAWIPVESVAIGGRSEVMNFISPKEFLVVTGDKIQLDFNPTDKRTSERVYDMGCVLPLATDIPEKVARRAPFGTFVVMTPVREPDGSLTIIPALLPRSAEVNLGFLPYTKGNLLRQSFKFIGERYGWGDMYNGRDCSGIVRSVYSTFGFRMARNGTEQNLQMRGKFWDFSNIDPSEIKSKLSELETGDIMRFPGHTVMFLGRYNGKNYIIHDASGSSFMVEDGKKSISFWGVGVTPLDDMLGSGKDGLYQSTLQNVKRLQ